MHFAGLVEITPLLFALCRWLSALCSSPFALCRATQNILIDFLLDEDILRRFLSP